MMSFFCFKTFTHQQTYFIEYTNEHIHCNTFNVNYSFEIILEIIIKIKRNKPTNCLPFFIKY